MEFMRSLYNYDRQAVSDETALIVEGDPVTQQQFAEDADINTIVYRFGLTGKVPQGFRMPMSGDFTGVSDFHSAMNAIREAEEAFLEVPGHVRERFGHDPQKLMDFLADDKNREEALKLGLLQPGAERARDGSPVAAAPAA